jgi:hypothetical protein
VVLTDSRVFRRVSLLVPCIVCAIGFAALSNIARGQQERGVVAEGYITALHAPTGFEINGTHVSISPSTGYRLFGEKKSRTDGPLRDAVQIGSYVFVEGPFDRHTKTATARTVVFRDDWDLPVFGVGVIDKVASAGPQPVFRADGYLIRLSPATKCSFHGEVKSLSDVSPNTWLRFQAKRGKDGLLDASTAGFFRVKAKAVKHAPDAHTIEMNFVPPDLAANKDGNINLGVLGKPRPILADVALQSRVMRVGADVVPAYQKAMADDDPFKVVFRFYAIDNEPACLEGCVLHGGLTLISKQSVDRLKNDSQLAAVLAECVVNQLQRQGAGVAREGFRQLGATMAEDAGLIAISPLFAVPEEITWSIEKVEIERLEQRQRLALALVDDAGYDPWQAPEAWRLLAPKHLPQDIESLKYPPRSEYQLGTLNLLYPRKLGAGNATPSPLLSTDRN